MSSENFVIRQPAGQRTLALRESYLAICDGDACEAHLLNANERWYAYKIKGRDEARGRNKAARTEGEAPDAGEALWVRMHASGWATDLLGQYNEKTIRLKLARLVERGFLATRSSPDRKWDRTPQWLFQRAAVQAAVDAWEASRPTPDLDPSPADDGEATTSLHPDNGAGSTRTNVRMQSEEVLTQVGHSSGSSRTNVRGNNTGIPHRDLLQRSSTGGELDVTSSTRATESVSAPVAEPCSAPVTTTDAALKTAPERQTQPGASVAVLPPDGGASNEAVTEDLAFLFSQSESEHETSTPRTLRNVLRGPQEAQEGPFALEQNPHDPDETRAVLMPALGGHKKLDALMEETPPGLRGRTRRAWVNQVTPERAREIVLTGRQEAGADNPWTYIIRLLDQEIGGSIRQGSGFQPAGAAAPGSVERHDPRLAAGERCSVGDRLGVVFEVTNAGYIVDLDNGERVTVNRALAAQLRSLRQSTSPLPEALPAAAPAVLADVGTRWQARAGGEVVTVTSVDGMQRALSSGVSVPVYTLTAKFVRLEAGQ